MYNEKEGQYGHTYILRPDNWNNSLISSMPNGSINQFSRNQVNRMILSPVIFFSNKLQIVVVQTEKDSLKVRGKRGGKKIF